jgi:hypothetical protein
VGDMSCGLSVGVLECVRIFRYDIFEGEAKSAKSNDGKASQRDNHNPACTRTRHGGCSRLSRFTAVPN